MKRTTRFITLVLTLILALSCSMQIFAEEVDPYALRICRHEICAVEPNVPFIKKLSGCRWANCEGDRYTCVECNFVQYKNDSVLSYFYEHVWEEDSTGIVRCRFCLILPENAGMLESMP